MVFGEFSIGLSERDSTLGMLESGDTEGSSTLVSEEAVIASTVPVGVS